MLDLVKKSIHQDPQSGELCPKFARIQNGGRWATVAYRASPSLNCERCGFTSAIILRVIEDA